MCPLCLNCCLLKVISTAENSFLSSSPPPPPALVLICNFFLFLQLVRGETPQIGSPEAITGAVQRRQIADNFHRRSSILPGRRSQSVPPLGELGPDLRASNQSVLAHRDRDLGSGRRSAAPVPRPGPQPGPGFGVGFRTAVLPATNFSPPAQPSPQVAFLAKGLRVRAYIGTLYCHKISLSSERKVNANSNVKNRYFMNNQLL